MSGKKHNPTLEELEQRRAEGLEQQMLSDLRAQAAGFDAFGRRLSAAEQQAAIKGYQELSASINARAAEKNRVKNETDLVALERDRLAAEMQAREAELQSKYDLESRRIQIEEDKLVIQKADVLVRALEVAAKGGVSPDKLLEAITNFGNNLLPGSMNPQRLIAKREEGES